VHIGAAIFLIAIIWFAIAYPSFRRFLAWSLASIAALIAVLIIIGQVNQSQEEARMAAARQKAAAAEAAGRAAYEREVDGIFQAACLNAVDALADTSNQADLTRDAQNKCIKI
jgi:hypothetical protein